MIQVKSLSKYYGDVVGVEEVSFEIHSPGATVIFGSSGSGKTTLLRLIAGLDAPDQGEIYLGGALASTKDFIIPAHARNVGFVFQAPALWPHMTVSANILFGLHALEKKEAQQRLEAVLGQMGLEELARRFPDQISAGQARRVALARALAPKPQFLFMDEPLTNIDAKSKESLMKVIQDVGKDTKTFLLYVSHDEQEVRQISERTIVIDGGRLRC